jgi:hypothetical protein
VRKKWGKEGSARGCHQQTHPVERPRVAVVHDLEASLEQWLGLGNRHPRVCLHRRANDGLLDGLGATEAYGAGVSIT